jgi:hypothetical protein
MLLKGKALQEVTNMDATNKATTTIRILLFMFFTSLLSATPEKSVKSLFSWSWY